MDNPLSGLTWLYARKGRTGSADDLLRRRGRGEIALTHEAFHTLQPWRAAAHLRDLLMSCGVLPTVDKQICSFERWLVSHLADITDPDHVQLVRRFATWEVLPHLRTRAEKKPITPAGRRHAGEQGQARRGLPSMALRARPRLVHLPTGRHRRLAHRAQRARPRHSPGLPAVVHGQQAHQAFPAARRGDPPSDIAPAT